MAEQTPIQFGALKRVAIAGAAGGAAGVVTALGRSPGRPLQEGEDTAGKLLWRRSKLPLIRHYGAGLDGGSVAHVQASSIGEPAEFKHDNLADFSQGRKVYVQASKRSSEKLVSQINERVGKKNLSPGEFSFVKNNCEIAANGALKLKNKTNQAKDAQQGLAIGAGLGAAGALAFPKAKSLVKAALKKFSAKGRVINFADDLQPHQRRVVNKMLEANRKGLVVVHGLGSGKTRTAIEVHKALGGDADVVVPAALQGNYLKEVEKWGGDKKRTHIQSQQRAANGNEPLTHPLMIVDEGHRARNPKTNLSDALRSTGAKKRLILSATPIYNSPSDIATLVNHAAGENVMREGKAFDGRYLKPNPIQKMRGERLSNSAELKKHLKAYVDYHKGDPSMLPTVESKTVPVEMTKHQSELYRASMGTVPKHLKVSQENIDRLKPYLTGPRQISNTSNAVDPGSNHEPKIDRAFTDLQKHLEDPHGKALVYSNWIDHGVTPMQTRMTGAKIPHGVFTGNETLKARNQTVKDYNSGKHRALIISSSGAEGLDLKGTRMVQIMEPHFNNAKTRQVIGRSARMGSHSHLPPEQRNVQVRQYVSRPQNRFLKGSSKGVEDMLNDSARDKDEVARQITNLFRDMSPIVMLSQKLKLIRFDRPSEERSKKRQISTKATLAGTQWNDVPQIRGFRDALLSNADPSFVKHGAGRVMPEKKDKNGKHIPARYVEGKRTVTSRVKEVPALDKDGNLIHRQYIKDKGPTPEVDHTGNAGTKRVRGPNDANGKATWTHVPITVRSAHAPNIDRGGGAGPQQAQFPSDWRDEEKFRQAKIDMDLSKNDPDHLHIRKHGTKEQKEALRKKMSAKRNEAIDKTHEQFRGEMQPMRNKLARDVRVNRAIVYKWREGAPSLKLALDGGKRDGEKRSWSRGNMIGEGMSKKIRAVRDNMAAHIKANLADELKINNEQAAKMHAGFISSAKEHIKKAKPHLSEAELNNHATTMASSLTKHIAPDGFGKDIDAATKKTREAAHYSPMTEALGLKTHQEAKNLHEKFQRLSYTTGHEHAIHEIEDRMVKSGQIFESVKGTPTIGAPINTGRKSFPALKKTLIGGGLIAGGLLAAKLMNRQKKQETEMSALGRLIQFAKGPKNISALVNKVRKTLRNKQPFTRLEDLKVTPYAERLIGQIPAKPVLTPGEMRTARTHSREQSAKHAAQAERERLQTYRHNEQAQAAAEAKAAGAHVNSAEARETTEPIPGVSGDKNTNARVGHSGEQLKQEMENKFPTSAPKYSEADMVTEKRLLREQAERDKAEALKQATRSLRKKLLIGAGITTAGAGIGGYMTGKPPKEMEFAMKNKDDQHPSTAHDVAVGGLEGSLGVMATDPLIQRYAGEHKKWENPLKGISNKAGRRSLLKKIGIGGLVGAAATGLIGAGVSAATRRREQSATKELSSKLKAIRFSSEAQPSRGMITRDKYEKAIYEKEEDRGRGHYYNSAIGGAALATALMGKTKLSLRKSLMAGAGAGLGTQLLTRMATSRTKDQFGERSHIAKKIDSAPATAAGLASAGLILHRAWRGFSAKGRVIQFGMEKWVGNDGSDGRSVRKVNYARRAEDIRAVTSRTGGMIRDIGGLARGEKAMDSRGRPRKREWEKPWAQHALHAGILATTLGSMALMKKGVLHSKVGRDAVQSLRDGSARNYVLDRVPGVKKAATFYHQLRGDVTDATTGLVTKGEGVARSLLNKINAHEKTRIGKIAKDTPHTRNQDGSHTRHHPDGSHSVHYKDGSSTTYPMGTPKADKLTKTWDARKALERKTEEVNAPEIKAQTQAEEAAAKLKKFQEDHYLASRVKPIYFQKMNDSNGEYDDNWEGWLRNRPGATGRHRREKTWGEREQNKKTLGYAKEGGALVLGTAIGTFWGHGQGAKAAEKLAKKARAGTQVLQESSKPVEMLRGRP